MAKIGFQNWSGKRLKVREKSVKSQGILKWILSGNPDGVTSIYSTFNMIDAFYESSDTFSGMEPNVF